MKSITDNKNISLQDKILSHYIDGVKLNEVQEKKRVQYEQAHSLRLNGMSREQTVKMLLSRGITGSMREAYRIVSDSEQLFGDVNAVHKDGLRHILTENLMKIYNKALLTGQFKEAIRANEISAKINNLLNHDISPIDWTKILIPIPVYTSDPKILKQQETIDITHYELKSNNEPA